MRQGVRPDLIAFTPDGEFAYISNRDSAQLIVMETNTHRVIKKISVGNGGPRRPCRPDAPRIQSKPLETGHRI